MDQTKGPSNPKSCFSQSLLAASGRPTSRQGRYSTHAPLRPCNWYWETYYNESKAMPCSYWLTHHPLICPIPFLKLSKLVTIIVILYQWIPQAISYSVLLLVEKCLLGEWHKFALYVCAWIMIMHLPLCYFTWEAHLLSKVGKKQRKEQNIFKSWWATLVSHQPVTPCKAGLLDKCTWKLQLVFH